MNNADHGFNIALAIIRYDGSSEPLDLADYGELSARTFSWGLEDGYVIRELPLERCSGSSLAKIYPPVNPGNAREFEFYKSSLMCISDDFDIQGNANSQKAQLLQISFKKCDFTKRQTCKSEDEIQDWLNGLLLMTVENNESFS